MFHKDDAKNSQGKAIRNNGSILTSVRASDKMVSDLLCQ